MARQGSDSSGVSTPSFRDWCVDWLRTRAASPLLVDVQLPDSMESGKALSIVLRLMDDPPRNPKGNATPVSLVNEILTEETADKLGNLLQSMTGGNAQLWRDALCYVVFSWATVQEYVLAAKGLPSEMPNAADQRFDSSREDGREQLATALESPMVALDKVLLWWPEGMTLPTRAQGFFGTIPPGRLFPGQLPDLDAELYPSEVHQLQTANLKEVADLVAGRVYELGQKAEPATALAKTAELGADNHQHEPENLMERVDSGWRIRYGGVEATVRDSDRAGQGGHVGMHYIAMLLSAAGRPYYPTTLTASIDGEGKRTDAAKGYATMSSEELMAENVRIIDDLASYDEASDKTAQRQYRERLKTLESSLEIARETSSPEVRTLVEEIRELYELIGRKYLETRHANNARTSVKKAIERAIAHLPPQLEALSDHLLSRLERKRTCCYKPEKRTRWEIRAH